MSFNPTRHRETRRTAPLRAVNPYGEGQRDETMILVPAVLAAVEESWLKSISKPTSARIML